MSTLIEHDRNVKELNELLLKIKDNKFEILKFTSIIVLNIIDNPTTIRFKKVKTSSKLFKENILNNKFGLLILNLFGFQLIDNDKFIELKEFNLTNFKNLYKVLDENNFKKPLLHKFMIAENLFEITTRYEIKSIIGQGAYGVVCSAYDHLLKKKVAIKKILKTFEHGKEYQKRILREIKVMRHCRNHSNVISMIDLIPPPSFDKFKDIYIVMDFMDADMRSLIRNSKQVLTDENIQYFLVQILQGLKRKLSLLLLIIYI